MRFSNTAITLAAAGCTANALNVDPNGAAKPHAQAIMGQYDGESNGNPDALFATSLDSSISFAASPAIWEAMINYWHLTDDSTYNDIVGRALISQAGPSQDFMQPNQTKTESNDDQSLWALAALTAAERNFTAPNNVSSWQKLASNVFDDQLLRWDNATCNGGLRWPIFSFNAAYTYKNAASNGNFFNLAARLAHLTGNQTFSSQAEASYHWMEQSGLAGNSGQVYDGFAIDDNCTKINQIEWSYNSGSLLLGAAVMFNLTKGGSKIWKERIDTVLSRSTSVFFKNGVMQESACETRSNCDAYQRFFKGLYAIDLARTAEMAPYTAPRIVPLLTSTAKAAAAACDSSGANCKYSWVGASNANLTDLGAQVSVLDAIEANLIASTISGKMNQSSFSNSTSNGNGGGGKTSGAITSFDHASTGMSIAWMGFCVALFSWVF